MAMVTISGFPSSGKSTRALELSTFFSQKIQESTLPSIKKLKILIINDESLNISKSSYDDSKSEKPSRATLLSAVMRYLNSDTILIIDAMNYIKGSRYQMYCTAREMGVRACTVYVATPPDKCKEWNLTRTPPLDSYIEPTIDNLIQRFEEPSSAARWDSPLITIPSFDPPISTTEDSPANRDAERIWEAITTGTIKPPNSATLMVATSTTSYLTILESTTSLLLTTLLSVQSLSPLTSPTSLLIPTTPPIKIQIQLKKTLTMAIGQRLKRQFTKLQQQGGTELSVGVLVELFARFLEAGN